MRYLISMIYPFQFNPLINLVSTHNWFFLFLFPILNFKTVLYKRSIAMEVRFAANATPRNLYEQPCHTFIPILGRLRITLIRWISLPIQELLSPILWINSYSGVGCEEVDIDEETYLSSCISACHSVTILQRVAWSYNMILNRMDRWSFLWLTGLSERVSKALVYGDKTKMWWWPHHRKLPPVYGPFFWESIWCHTSTRTNILGSRGLLWWSYLRPMDSFLSSRLPAMVHSMVWNISRCTV